MLTFYTAGISSMESNLAKFPKVKMHISFDQAIPVVRTAAIFIFFIGKMACTRLFSAM